MGPFLLAPGLSSQPWREPQQRAFRCAANISEGKCPTISRYLSSDKNTRRYSSQRRSSSPPPPAPSYSTPPTQHSSSPLSSSCKSSPSPQPSSETSSENSRMSVYPNKLEKQLGAGEDVEVWIVELRTGSVHLSLNWGRPIWKPVNFAIFQYLQIF